MEDWVFPFCVLADVEEVVEAGGVWELSETLCDEGAGIGSVPRLYGGLGIFSGLRCWS